MIGRKIERPADLLWHLLQHAVDRGATEVAVTVENGGLSKLQVYHNGEGFGFSSLATQFKGTGEMADLIAEIAPYCELRISSCTEKEEEGGYLQSINGRVAALYRQSCKPGMEISVINLYFNLPEMYRKFDRASREKIYCMEVAQNFYLGYGFSMRWVEGPGNELYIPAQAKLSDRVMQVYKEELDKLMQLSLPGGTLYLLSQGKYASREYGLRILAENRPCPIADISKAVAKVSREYMWDNDIPASIIVWEHTPTAAQTAEAVERILSDLPAIYQEVYRTKAIPGPKRTEGFRKRTVTLQATLYHSCLHGDGEVHLGEFDARIVGNELWVVSEDGGCTLAVPLKGIIK
jgi:DNA mismatch repair ATPase MutL